MHAEPAASDSDLPSLQRVLLAYLEAADVLQWPGVDGLTLRDVLVIYPQAMAGGRVPSRQELLRKHPNLREDLDSFLGEE